MENQINNNWDTTYDTARKTFIHEISKRVSVVSNINTNRVRVFKGAECIGDYSLDMGATVYLNFLSNLAETERLEELAQKEAVVRGE